MTKVTFEVLQRIWSLELEAYFDPGELVQLTESLDTMALESMGVLKKVVEPKEEVKHGKAAKDSSNA